MTEVMPKPVLMINTGTKDKEVCRRILEIGMPCEFLATDGEDTPILIDGFRQIRGIKQIISFVEGWERNNLPRENAAA